MTRQRFMTDEQLTTITKMIEDLKPEYAPCSLTMRAWFETTALPFLRDSALSSLWRYNRFEPHLFGFMEQGPPGIINLQTAFDKQGYGWGDVRSKNITAHMQRVSACIPGTVASIFCVETWVLKNITMEERKKYDSIHDHPYREEALMFNMLHYNWSLNQMMQLTCMLDIVKVLGKNVSPEHWRSTTLGAPQIVDPMDRVEGRPRMVGRFIPGAPDKDDA